MTAQECIGQTVELRGVVEAAYPHETPPKLRIRIHGADGTDMDILVPMGFLFEEEERR